MLDSARGLAALWVVLFHLTFFVPEPESAALATIWGGLFRTGRAGVPVFFVLSGFVLTHSVLNRPGFRKAPKTFLVERLLRLTGPYWAAIAFSIVADVLSSHITDRDPFFFSGFQFTWRGVFYHLFYTHEIYGYPSLNAAFWTLAIELQFYAVFVVILATMASVAPLFDDKRRLYPTATVVLGGLSLVGAMTSDAARPNTFVPLFYTFFLGMAAYWVATARLRAVWLLGLLVPYGPLAWVHLRRGSIWDAGYMPAALVFTIALLLAAKLDAFDRWLVWPVLQFLGRISYSLYLIHLPILTTVSFLVHDTIGSDGPGRLVSVVVSIAAIIAVSTAFWYVVERPTSHWPGRLRHRVLAPN